MPKSSFAAPSGLVLGRRYGVPAAMVQRATERRLAGDWRGAGAAALVDIKVDLDQLRRTHGTDMAAAVEADLRHLAPDLLRWHLPRAQPWGLLYAAGGDIVLASYDGGCLLLTARLPGWADAQRVVVRLSAPSADGVGQDWTRARYAWDVRAAPQLLARVGGGDRTPFFDRDGTRWSRPGVGDDAVAVMERVLLLQEAGEIERAWRVGGVHVDPGFAAARLNDRGVPLPVPRALDAMVPALAATAWAVLQAQPEATRLMLACGYTSDRTAVAVRVEEGRLRADRIPEVEAARLPRLAQVLWHRLPELAMLRARQVDGEHLHPLVRAALFPDQPGPGYHPLTGAVGNSTVDGLAGGDMRVRCGEAWHRIGWRDGRLVTVDHPPEDLRRERAIRALGGQLRGCLQVVDARSDPAQHWRPRRSMRLLFRHALLAARHGDGDELVRLLDAGVKVATIHDRHGATLLHHLAKVDGGTSDHPATALALLLLDRLLAAPLSINAEVRGRATPLAYMLSDGASAALVRAVLAAGAQVGVRLAHGRNLLHYVHCEEGDQIVPWLVRAGADPNAQRQGSETPLATQLRLQAPAATIRATLAAGARLADVAPHVLEWARRREDLGFLADAADE